MISENLLISLLGSSAGSTFPTQREAEQILLWCEKNETQILRPCQFPIPLQNIPLRPKILFVRGNRDCLQLPLISVVGARQASAYGLACAFRFGKEIASAGLGVVSGLAKGIDGASHRGALVGQGKTIAVLGAGFACLYPKQHQRLAFEILEKGGAWVSEYPPFTPPLAHHFPQRNRIISGLSLGTLVVEARKKSGSLITAICSLEQGREVFVVPGPIDQGSFQGAHELIQQGAKLVLSLEDIIEEISLQVPQYRKKILTSSVPYPFGESFTLSEWLEKAGEQGLAKLESAISTGEIFETAPQRYLSIKQEFVEATCQMQKS